MQLPKVVNNRKKRAGRGIGSGRGKTAGRGMKGQKARGRVPVRFEGGQLPMIKRLPFLRGKSRNRSYQIKPFPLNVVTLNAMPANTTVTIASLIEHNVLTSEQAAQGVKLLGAGAVEKSFTVDMPTSSRARAKIEKAGGKVIGVNTKEPKQ